jgi:uncharacterized membrane protein
MSFCPTCGASVDGRFCPKCGSAAAMPAGAVNAAAPAITMDAAAASGAGAGLTENAASALCYLGGLITGIVFLAIAPYNQNPRIKFHAFQSILFSLVWALGWFMIVAVGIILPFSMSVMVSLFSVLLWGGVLLIWLLLLWKAYQGETLSMPVIGDIAHKQAGK